MRFRISGALLRFTDYRGVIDVDAPTVEAALVKLADAHRPLRNALFDRQGNLRGVHKIFLNGEQLTADQLTRPAGACDDVDVITAISGG